MVASISGKPTAKISGFGTPKRSNTTMTFKWSIPKAVYDTNSRTRAEWVDAYLYFVSNKKDPKTKKVAAFNKIERWKGQSFNINKTTGHDRIHCRGFGNQMAEISQAYRRELFYPKTNLYLLRVYGVVWLGNSKGDGCSKTQSPYYEFKPPYDPKISTADISENGNNQRVMVTITHDEGTGVNEYYDMVYCYTRKDNFTSTYKNEKVISQKDGKASWITTGKGATSVKPYVDMGDTLNLQANQWVEITFKAYARGIAGNSKTVTRSHIFARPAVPKITGISASGLSPTDLVIIKINTNHQKYRPVDEIEIEHAVTSNEVDNASEIPPSAWQSAAGGVKDNSNCQGFSELVADTGLQLVDDQGHYTGQRLWYRLRTHHDSMDMVSAPVEATVLHKQPWTGETIGCKVDSLSNTKGEEGSAITARISWAAAGQTNMKDTEVSWAKKANAWNSTEPPTTYVTSESILNSSTGRYYCDLVIKGLDAGETYYVKARRHGTDSNGNDVYGAYSAVKELTPTYVPENVQLSVPSFIVPNKNFQVSWSFDGLEQKEWWVFWRRENGKKTVVATGKGVTDSAKIKWNKDWNGLDSIKLYVAVSSGGGKGYSHDQRVSIAYSPSVLGLNLADVLSSKPLRFDVIVDRPNVDLIVKVSASGIVSAEPDGKIFQAPGDIVWSKRLSGKLFQPVLNDILMNGDLIGFSYTVAVPDSALLIDGGDYLVSVTPIDRVSGLESPSHVKSFFVDYSYKPSPPIVRPTYIVERSKGIVLQQFDSSSAGFIGTLEIYRVTPEGVQLIADNQRGTHPIYDPYAPFSKNTPLYYRVAVRTKDGWCSWTDIQYELRGYQIRFDWGEGEYVELPYNLKYNSSWTKSFDGIEYLDSAKPVGYWGEMVKRSCSLSTEIVRLEDHDLRKRVLSLAQYSGPVFVRTPDGAAFCANVEVSGLDNSYNSLTQQVSFKATEIEMVDAFKAVVNPLASGT